MGDQWEEGRRQLKINRVRLAKRKLADSAKEVLKTTNLGRTTIANARAVTGRTATIPVKNMNKSMALEKPKTKPQKVLSVAGNFGRKALKILTPVYIADSAWNLFGPDGVVEQTFSGAREHGRQRGIRHRKNEQIKSNKRKSKHLTPIINSALRKIKDR